MEDEKKSHSKQLHYVAAGLAAMALIATAGTYQKTASLTTKLSDQNAAIGSLTRQVAAQEQNFENHQTKITELHTVTKKLASNGDEASFAMQMAIYELELLQNYDKTIEYLEAAKLYIQDDSIAKQITSAIATLKQIPRYDTVTKLDELDQIKARLINLDSPPAKTHSTEPALHTDNKAMSFLGKFVTVSYSDSSTPKLLNSKQQYMLEANMLSLINQIQAALANRNTTLFHNGIAKLEDLLTSHYPQNTQIIAIKTELQHLGSLDLTPKTPDLQTILHAIYSNMAKNTKHAEHIQQSHPTAKKHDSQKSDNNTNKPHVTEEF